MNVLSSLTRDEILVIGTYIRCHKLVYEEEKTKNTLFMGTVEPNTWNKLISELMPSSLPTEEHVSVICGSLLRTGITSALPPTLGHSASHSFTILLKEISNLVDFEKAYREYAV